MKYIVIIQHGAVGRPGNIQILYVTESEPSTHKTQEIRMKWINRERDARNKLDLANCYH